MLDVTNVEKFCLEKDTVKRMKRQAIDWEKIFVCTDMEKLESLYIASGNVKWCSCYGKLVVPQKAKHRITYDPEVPPLGIYPKK